MSSLEHFILAIKEGKGWLLFNAAGVGIYLAIQFWMLSPRIPEEAFNGIDQICFWQTQEFPLLALYLGVNITWLLMKRQSVYFLRRQFLIWLLMGLVWGIVIIRDPIAVKIIVLVIPMMIERAWDHL